MVVGTETGQEDSTETERSEAPLVSMCESRPGKAVLLEDGNTDGWIASDTTSAVTR